MWAGVLQRDNKRGIGESWKVVIRALFNLQEMVDAIIACKPIERNISMGAKVEEDGDYGEEIVASVKEKGEVSF